jgi:outer membrane protein OmpA-like peptidoglycan-associated protein
MELRNELDLIDIFSQTSFLSPYYSGGVRINIAPHKNNISYFIHLSGMVVDYTDIAMDLKTSMFVWGAGISVQLPFHKPDEHTGHREDENRESYKDEDTEKNRGDEGINNKDNDVEILDVDDSAEPENSLVNKEVVVDPLIKSLSQMKNDETLSVPISLFTQSISELDENSIETLDKIIGFLKDNAEYAINIIGYSYFLGDPHLEIEQSMNRASIIREYFIIEGIEEHRITINSKALLYMENENDEGPYIMITRVK